VVVEEALSVMLLAPDGLTLFTGIPLDPQFSGFGGFSFRVLRVMSVYPVVGFADRAFSRGCHPQPNPSTPTPEPQNPQPGSIDGEVAARCAQTLQMVHRFPPPLARGGAPVYSFPSYTYIYR